MPPKRTKKQLPRESFRSRETRAEPADTAPKIDASDENAVTRSTQKKTLSAKAVLSDNTGPNDSKQNTEGATPLEASSDIEGTKPEEGSRTAKRKRAKVEEEGEEETPVNGDSPKKTKRSRKGKNEDTHVTSDEEGLPRLKRKSKSSVKQEVPGALEAQSDTITPKKRTKKPSVKAEDEVAANAEGKAETESPQKPKRKRKTQEEKEAEAMPLAARTTGLNMFIGAHVSCAKGVQNSVTNCVHIGGNAFAMFLKSQRKWENPPLQDTHRDLFHAACTEHEYDAAQHILPHGSYLVNLAQEDPSKHTQGYTAFIDDLHRCEALGIKLYNFHPGWTGPTATRESALKRIAESLNKAHKATKNVIPVLEAMAGSGSVIGGTFEDLAGIIEKVEDKSRVGVCIDTCHVFAAGYDLRTPSAFAGVMEEFDKVVGMKYLKALHLNDSKAPFGSHRDLHANIGTGFLGLRAFHNVMNEKRFEGLPMVLETPVDKKDPENEKKTIEDKGVWAREIKMLESLVGMDVEGEEFKKMEKELSETGKEEREKHLFQYERKMEKERKAGEKGKGKKEGKETAKGKQTTLKWGSGKKEAVNVEKDGSGSGSELSSLSGDENT